LSLGSLWLSFHLLATASKGVAFWG